MKLNKKNYIWLSDDLNVAKSAGQIWQIIKSKDINIKTKLKFILGSEKMSRPIDEIKLLNNKIIKEVYQITEEVNKKEIPEEILELKKERDTARAQKNWQKSDELREEIERGGYILEDKDGESFIKKVSLH